MIAFRAAVLCSIFLITLCDNTKFDGTVRPISDGREEAYMVPPYQSNHASFLELLPSGELLMAWFSGTAEGASNCSIVLSHLPAGSKQWSNASLISRRPGYSNQNPVLFMDKEGGVLYLYHSQQPATTGSSTELGNKEDRAHIWMLASRDGSGQKWTDPQELFSKDGSFDRNRIILSLNSSWIFPIYYSLDGDENQFSAMKLSSDHVTWTEHDVKNSNYLVQPSVIRPKLGKKNLMAYFRDRRHEHIYSSHSSDEGQSWSKPEATKLPNNNAAIEAAVLQSSRVALVYNPTTEERNVLSVSLSEDGGLSWKYTHVLEQSSSEDKLSAEYSYPSILQSPDGLIHVSYTFNRKTIKYVRFKEDWVMETP